MLHAFEFSAEKIHIILWSEKEESFDIPDPHGPANLFLLVELG